MNCRHVQKQITESLTVGHATPSPEMEKHRDSCVMCQEFYQREERLFASLETGVRGIVNEPVPPSLIPRVRVALEQMPAIYSVWSSQVRAAALVMVVVAVALAVLRNHGNHPAVPELAQVASQVANPSRPEPSSVPASPSVHHPKGAVVHPRVVRERTAEVIVLSGEREAMARFTVDRSQRESIAAALMASASVPDDSPVEIALLQVRNIEIPALGPMPQE